MSRSRKNPRISPADVLSCRVTVSFEQLFDLIHEINPTQKSLSGSDCDALYRTKSQLQSLLIERHRDILVLDEEEGSEGNVIGIRHRTYAKNACHAVVADLSPEAQSWVRWMRDVGGDVAGVDPQPVRQGAVSFEPPEVRDGDPLALLAQGEESLEAYDYDAARAAFEAAVAGRDLEIRCKAACALVGLLVDYLADNSAAMALWRRLPPPLQSNAHMRCLTAIAAVRDGDRQLGEQLIKDVVHERSADVALELAQAALDHREWERCHAWLEAIPLNSDAQVGVLRVREGLRRGRSEAAASAVESLREKAGTSDTDDLEMLSRAVLDIDPDNDFALETLAGIRRSSRQKDLAALHASILRSLGSADLAEGQRLMGQLPRGDERWSEFAARLTELQRVAEFERNRKAKDELFAMFEGGVTPRAVEALWQAAYEDRRALLARIDDPRLPWLEDLGSVTGMDRCRLVLEVAQALVDSEQAFYEDRVDAAAGFIQPYEDHVRQGSRGRQFWRKLVAQQSELNRQRAIEHLHAAIRLEQSDWPLAIEQCALVVQGSLNDSDRELYEAMTQRLAGVQSREKEKQLFRVLIAEGEILAARASAQRLAMECDDDHDWPSEVVILSDKIRSRWVEADTHGETLGRLSAELIAGVADHDVFTCVTPDGCAVVFAESMGPRMIVYVMGLNSKLSRAITLRPPFETRITSLQIEGELIFLIAGSEIVEIRLSDLELHAHRSIDRNGIRDSLLVEGGRYVWSHSPAEGIDVIEISSGRTLEHLPMCPILIPIVGAKEPTLVASIYRSDIRIHDGRGSRRALLRGEFVLLGASVAPDGEGVLLLRGDPRSVMSGSGMSASVGHWCRGVMSKVGFELGTVAIEGEHEIATAKSVACVFISYECEGDGRKLLALSLTSGGWQELWRIDVSQHCRLIRDDSGRHVAAHWLDRRMQVVSLGRNAPEVQGTVVTRVAAPDFQLSKSCGPVDARLTPTIRGFEAVVSLQSMGQLSDSVKRFIDDSLEVESLLALYSGLHSALDPCAARAPVVAALERVGSSDDRVRMILAEQEIRSGLFSAAAERLPELSRLRADEAVFRHTQHLLALARLACGEDRAAQKALRSARRSTNRAKVEPHEFCDLEALGEFVDALCGSKPGPTDTVSPAAHSACLRTADAALARDCPEDAISALSQPAVWWYRDRQVLARLARAWLMKSCNDPSTWFYSRRAVSAFLHHSGESHWVFGRHNWSEPKLKALELESRRFLGEVDCLVSSPTFRQEVERLRDDGATTTTRMNQNRHSLTYFLLSDEASEHRVISQANVLIPLALQHKKDAGFSHLVGLVVGKETKTAEELRSVELYERGQSDVEGDLVLLVSRQFAFDILAPMHSLYVEFLPYHSQTNNRNTLTVLLLAENGAMFHRFGVY